MSVGPTIIGHWEQAKINTARERKAENHRREKALSRGQRAVHERALPRRRVGSLQEIGFWAEHHGKILGPITVLAGEGAPTVVGGWVKVAKVPRFQRISITIPEGYDPLVLNVPILFDAVVQTKDRPDIESQIVTLEEMAGRPKGDTTGEPPYVEVFAADAEGNRTNLIPRKFQEDSELLWWITGINWDTNPLRDPGGERIRQAATVELTEIYLSGSARENAVSKRNKLAAGRPKTFKTTATVDTIKRVAKALASRFHNKALISNWQLLLKANPRLGNNPEKPLKHGTIVKIPVDFWGKIPR